VSVTEPSYQIKRSYG